MTIAAHFEVVGWEPVSYDRPDVGPELSRVSIGKKFSGEMDGNSSGEGLFCGLKTPQEGAGYVVTERFTGRIGTKSGSFVFQHGGLMGPGVPPHTFGNVVPGSGTGDLAGISGRIEIGRSEEGVHSLTLDYEL